MKVVADTNVVVSGSLWKGSPRGVLDAARDGVIQFFTSVALLEELKEVLSRERFVKKLNEARVSAHELVLGYAEVAAAVDVMWIEPMVVADPDDDNVPACAVAARADVIVSGDNHLLDLNEYKGIRILTAAELLAELSLDKS